MKPTTEAHRGLPGPAGWVEELVQESVAKLTGELGGPARRRAIIVLACVLGLNGADTAAVGVLAPQLESAFHIGNTEVGLLVTVASLVGALATLPVGVLADRQRRTGLLAASIAVWGVAELASGLSVSYLMLLITRLALGAITATAGPTVASLTGDLFPARERGRTYGFILTGELIASGIGVVLSGDVGSALGWRYGFFVLAIPSFILAWAVHHYLPEPARGGQSWINQGDEEIASAEEVKADPADYPVDDGQDEGGGRTDEAVLQEVRDEGVKPTSGTVLHGDAARMGMWETLRWVFRVHTNVVLIVASSLGYFFFAGLQVFAVIFLRGQYGISEGTATLLVLVVGAAAIIGILVSGLLSDALIRRGGRGRAGVRRGGGNRARLLVGAVGYVAAAVAFVPATLTTSLLVALPFLLVAGFFISAPNAPVDAARLDVVPSHMWGRAEAIRRSCAPCFRRSPPWSSGSSPSPWVGAAPTRGSAPGSTPRAPTSPRPARRGSPTHC